MHVSRAATIFAGAMLLVGLVGTGATGAPASDCFSDYGGVVGDDDIVAGNLLVTRQTPSIDPKGLGRGSICLVLGTVRGSVTVVDDSAACDTRPPFTALELAGGTIEGNARSVGNKCAMLWLRDGAWAGGTGASRVGGNVVTEAPGNLGFLGNGAGALIEGNAILQAVGSGLFATGTSNSNRVEGHLICEGGAPAGGAGTGTPTNWDGIETATDPGPDGTIGRRYAC